MGVFSRIARLRNRLETHGVDVLKDVNAVVDANVGGKHVSYRTDEQGVLRRESDDRKPRGGTT